MQVTSFALRLITLPDVSITETSVSAWLFVLIVSVYRSRLSHTQTQSRAHTQQHLPHLVLPLHCQAVLWSACSFNRTDLHPQTVREPIHRIAYTPTGACSKVWEHEHHNYTVHCRKPGFVQLL